MSDILTPGDVAKLFAVDPKTVSRWAKEDKIPHFFTPGGHVRFRRDEILALVTPVPSAVVSING